MTDNGKNRSQRGHDGYDGRHLERPRRPKANATKILMAVFGGMSVFYFQNCSEISYDSPLSEEAQSVSVAPPEARATPAQVLAVGPMIQVDGPPIQVDGDETSELGAAPMPVSTSERMPMQWPPTSTPKPTPTATPPQKVVSTPTATPLRIPTPKPTPTPVAAPEIPAQTQGYNFVAGSVDVCQQSIVGRLGVSAACSIGAGCSLSGKKPGAGEPSANPSYPGACLIGRTPPSPGDPLRQNYNFVAQDADSCASMVLRTLGLQGAVCVIGGGCAADGSLPGAGHPSANPNGYGICIPMSFY